MTLHKIKMKNIVDNYGDRSFRIHTQIISDVDGIIYSIITSVNTIDQGGLGILINYYGGDTAHMFITQKINNMSYSHRYNFEVSLFTKVFKRMLNYHLKQLSYKCIYSGCTDLIGLVNKVLQYGVRIIN